MSQNYVTNTPPGSTSGPTLATQIDARSDALLTSHSGAARPSYAKEGTLWLKNDGDPRELYFYDGSTDVLIAQVTSGGEVTFALGDELNGIAGLTVAVNRILYKNGAGNWDQAAITAFARTLIAAADAASARAALDASQSPIDEDDFASDSATRPPTQHSTGAYVATEIATMGGNQAGAAPVYAARAWVKFNGTGTVAIRSSGNVSSITDNGTGDYTVNYATTIPDADYAIVVSPGSGNSGDFFTHNSAAATPAASSARIRVGTAGPAGIDAAYVSVAVFR